MRKTKIFLLFNILGAKVFFIQTFAQIILFCVGNLETCWETKRCALKMKHINFYTKEVYGLQSKQNAIDISAVMPFCIFYDYK